VEIFEDVGHSLCIALLDMLEVNPFSRIPLSIHKTLDVSYACVF